MGSLLKMVCIALSIYYVFTASAPNSTVELVEQIINDLRTLKSVPQNYLRMQSLYPSQQKKNVSIEELSCRAQTSIEALKSNRTDKLNRLGHLLLHFTKDVNCTMVTYEEYEDMKTFIQQLLKEFRKYYIDRIYPY